MITAIYARISTKDKGQTNENQLRELRAFAERLGYTVYKEYCDQESGGSAERFQFQQLFVDAYQRRFDVVLFWSLDRFSREGVTETLNHLQKLQAAGVRSISGSYYWLFSRHCKAGACTPERTSEGWSSPQYEEARAAQYTK
jgi:DNA invertase Pin-like site-specific DNA recombinase